MARGRGRESCLKASYATLPLLSRGSERECYSGPQVNSAAVWKLLVFLSAPLHLASRSSWPTPGPALWKRAGRSSARTRRSEGLFNLSGAKSTTNWSSIGPDQGCGRGEAIKKTRAEEVGEWDFVGENHGQGDGGWRAAARAASRFNTQAPISLDSPVGPKQIDSPATRSTGAAVFPSEAPVNQSQAQPQSSSAHSY